MDAVTEDGAPDGGALSVLRCSLGYTRYRSGNREHRIKTADVDTDAAERRLRDDAVLIRSGAEEPSSRSLALSSPRTMNR